MKIFRTNAVKISLLTIILALMLSATAFAGVNLSREEIEAKIEEVATLRGIPAVLLKAIARVESNFQQFDAYGNPRITSTGNIGIMMVGNYGGYFDTNRLKYDIDYNIKAGADVLLTKWNMSASKSVSSVGNMDPNILENWYFALWAYNGWAASNNPNEIYKRYTYQETIYKICKEEFDQQINHIDTNYLPPSGKPSRGLVVPTPSNINSGNIVLYSVGDIVKVDGIRSDIYIRDSIGGSYTTKLGLGQMASIVEGPVLQNGYYWYKIKINDYTSGWIERNFLTRIGDTVNGVYPFKDLAYHWSRKNVMTLYNAGKISKNAEGKFYPEDNITRQELCVMLNNMLEYKSLDETQLRFKDAQSIKGWATPSIRALDSNGLLSLYGENFSPEFFATKGELTSILANFLIKQKQDEFITNGYAGQFDIEDAFNLDKVSIGFTDINNLNEVQVRNIKIVNSLGLITGDDNTHFGYTDHITRAQAASVMCKLINLIK